MSNAEKIVCNHAQLPYNNIAELRHIICPPSADSFRDWRWAIENSFDGPAGRDWFEVEPSLVDENDPDCVWRKRTVSDYSFLTECGSKSTRVIGKREVVELWSPVRWVAMYVRLELPLYTAQILCLDSGEADTFISVGRQWIRNPSQLARGTETCLYEMGVIRRSLDQVTGENMRVLFINTNKKVVPWEHPRVIPWLERLRDWQSKYNTIKAPVPWTSQKLKHRADLQNPNVLAETGEACFLFRNAADMLREDRDKPISGSLLGDPWYVLLKELERRCETRGETQNGGKKLVFVDPASRSSNFSPHSIRVSLITAFARDGKVPFAVLSKCTAVNRRAIMTHFGG